jgi:hypothetical protein
MATPGERVTVTPPSKSGGDTYVFQASGLGNLESKFQSAFQEFIDTVLVPMLNE